MTAEQLAVRERELDLFDCGAGVLRVGEVDAVVSKYGVHPVGHGCDQMAQEVGGDPGGRFLVQLDEGELGGSIDADEQVELALFGPHLGDVDMEEADRVGLELALRGFLTVDLRQA